MADSQSMKGYIKERIVQTFRSARFWKTWAFASLIYLLCLPYALVAGSPKHNWLVYLRVAQDFKTSTAEVSRTYAQNHCRFDYFFTANQTRMDGIGSDCSAKAGNRFTAYYLATDPSFSTASPPMDLFWNDFFAVLTGFIMIPAAFAFRASRKKWFLFGPEVSLD